MTARSIEATLQDRIVELYEVFHRYRLDPLTEWEPWNQPLHAAARKSLPASAFEKYHRSALTSWGSLRQFKHLLPRMLELISEPLPDDKRLIEPFYLFSQLAFGEWRTWPVRERQALDAYFEALWAALLAREMGLLGRWCPIREWLYNLSLVHGDLSSFLTQWEVSAADQSEGLIPSAHLADILINVRDHPKGNSLWSDDFHDLDNQKLHAKRWLASKSVSELLEVAYFRWPESAFAGLISNAQDWQGYWRKTRVPDD